MVYVAWCHTKGIWVAAIPNETPTQHMVGRTAEGKPIWRRKKKASGVAKAMGVSEGFPDTLTVVPCSDGQCRLLAIEFKSPKLRPKGKPKPGCAYGVRPEQRAWLDQLERCMGVGTLVAYSAEDAIGYVEQLMHDIDFFKTNA
jgi:hypothetical protein